MRTQRLSLAGNFGEARLVAEGAFEMRIDMASALLLIYVKKKRFGLASYRREKVFTTEKHSEGKEARCVYCDLKRVELRVVELWSNARERMIEHLMLRA